MKEISRDDRRAIALISCFIWWPLFIAALPNLSPESLAEQTQYALQQNEWQRVLAGTHATDWILAIVGVAQFIVIGVQTRIYQRQRKLMDRQADISEQMKNDAMLANRAFVSLKSLTRIAPETPMR